MQKLQRAFRDLRRDAPEYDFFAVQTETQRTLPGPAEARPTAAGEALPSRNEGRNGTEALPETEEEPRSLLPAGPLHAVEIRPRRSRVERLGRRALRALAHDANGVSIAEDVSWEWIVREGPATLEPNGPKAVVAALDIAGDVRIALTARHAGRTAEAEAVVQIVDDLGCADQSAGIPEPQFVEDPHGEWRSRLADGRWEVNQGHRDFLAVAGQPRRKLRYLAALLAKEVVVHSFPLPQGGALLERLVSVLTLTEPRLERG